MKFNKGDLVKSNHNAPVFHEKECYGIVLDVYPDVPKKHPLLVDKYKVKWLSGGTSWIFSHSIVLISKGKV